MISRRDSRVVACKYGLSKTKAINFNCMYLQRFVFVIFRARCYTFHLGWCCLILFKALILFWWSLECALVRWNLVTWNIFPLFSNVYYLFLWTSLAGTSNSDSSKHASIPKTNEIISKTTANPNQRQWSRETGTRRRLLFLNRKASRRSQIISNRNFPCNVQEKTSSKSISAAEVEGNKDLAGAR